LKKFHASLGLDGEYLASIQSLLPQAEGFVSGTARQILSSGSLQRAWGCFHSKGLAAWLDGAILMPRIGGVAWADEADEIRDGRIWPDSVQRVGLSRSLAQQVALMEQSSCCHRDLSAGNVFIDANSCTVRLIDFDSMYHPSLQIPSTTTSGTAGYIAPFVWNGGNPAAAATWRPLADRFALALLIVEFLTMRPGAALTSDGGMFDQDELCHRSGTGLAAVSRWIKEDLPNASPLLDSALHARCFDDCPSPREWELCLNGDARFNPPELPPEEPLLRYDDARSTARHSPVAPKAPPLNALPAEGPELPGSFAPIVTLPPDPWET
jgi:serine/threonine protein kinase